jgi:antitoxin HicB
MLVHLNAKIPLDIVQDEDGIFVVTCPLLPEMFTQGETLEQALENARYAFETTIEAYIQLGRALPEGISVDDTKELFEARMTPA